MRLAEEKKIVPIMSIGDLNAGATLSGDSINMENYHRCTFLVMMHALGGAANYILIYSGATAAALTTAETFHYAFGGAATESASADVLAADATSANLSVAHATYDNYMLVCEIDASDMTAGQPWLTFSCADTDGGATGGMSVFAVLEPRYSGNRSVTALT